MNLEKSREYFDPANVPERIHVVGCGSVGATIAEQLVRSGLTKLTLWDFDTVEPKNLANQIYRQKDVYQPKTEALKDILCEINPEAKDDIVLKGKWEGQQINGYVFLAVDNIETRKAIVKKIYNNLNVKAVFDVRTRLEDAQHYAADWSDLKMKKIFLDSMEFTHEEAEAETPMSACHTVLSVVPTIRVVCGLAVANFMNFVRGEGLKKLILVDAYKFVLDAF